MTEAPDVRVEGLVIEGEVWLAAPAERVFDALTQPEWLAAWWGDEEAYTTHDWQIAPVAMIWNTSLMCIMPITSSSVSR